MDSNEPKLLAFDQLKSNTKGLTFNYLKKKFNDILGLERLDESVLISTGLIWNNTYNNASELLSDNGSIMQSSLEISKFKLDTNTVEDRLYLKEKSVLEYFDEALAFFAKYYSKQELVGGITRKIVEPIPFVAFKEALASALVHRDYQIKNGIGIAMFDNRIEISFPGTVPEGISSEVCFTGVSLIQRNPILSYVFFRLGNTKQFGTKIERVFNSYSDYFVKHYFEINKYQVKIVLPVVNYDYTKFKAEDGIIAFLRAYPESNRQSIENALFINKAKTLRKLNKLESKNMVVKLGSGVSTKYKLNF